MVWKLARLYVESLVIIVILWELTGPLRCEAKSVQMLEEKSTVLMYFSLSLCVGINESLTKPGNILIASKFMLAFCLCP